jgi:hypothetical protein
VVVVVGVVGEEVELALPPDVWQLVRGAPLYWVLALLPFVCVEVAQPGLRGSVRLLDWAAPPRLGVYPGQLALLP